MWLMAIKRQETVKGNTWIDRHKRGWIQLCQFMEKFTTIHKLYKNRSQIIFNSSQWASWPAPNTKSVNSDSVFCLPGKWPGLSNIVWLLKVSPDMKSSRRNHPSCKPFQIFCLLYIRSPLKSRSAICESIAVHFQGIKCSVNENK